MRRRLDSENAIRAYPAMAVTKPRDARGIQGKRLIAIVNHDEIVARPVHFGEGELHEWAKLGGLRSLHKWSNEVPDALGKVGSVGILCDLPYDRASNNHRIRLPGHSCCLLAR